MKVKICGITNLDDALLAVNFGADFLGFILFKKSQRYISLCDSKKIIQSLPKNILKVAVLVDEDENILEEIINSNMFDVLQLHGNETPEFCNELRRQIKIFKAFRVKKQDDVAKLKEYNVDGYLLDTFSDDMFGGTGKVFDWRIAVDAKKLASPIILSGGLNVENIDEAIKFVNPYCVDVSSGIESYPGKKDENKMREFINKCKN